MPNMLAMPTGQLGDPVTFLVEVEARDATLHIPPVPQLPCIL